MDLSLETTLKVIESRNAACEHLTVFKDNLKQYEDYINAMKDDLEETLLKNSRNKEILEMDNLTKNAFNENCKRIKDLLGIVRNYTQQVQGRLATIMDQEASLEETFNKNKEWCGLLDTKYNNNLKLPVTLETDSVEKLAKERSEIEDHLNGINEEFIALSESWKSVMDEQNEKYKTLQATMLEVEILHDKLLTKHEEEDLYVKTMQETKEKKQKLVEEVTKDIEGLDDQLLEIEKDISEMLHTKSKECTKINKKILHDQNQARMKFEELSKNLLTKNEQDLLLCNAEKVEVRNENDQMRLKTSASTDDCENLKIQFEALQQRKEEILRKIAEVEEEHEQLRNDYDKLNGMPNCKNDLFKKECELQELKSSPNTELLKIEEDIAQLERDYSSKKQNLQNDIQVAHLHYKQQQQTVEKLESTLEDLELQFSQSETEKNTFVSLKSEKSD